MKPYTLTYLSTVNEVFYSHIWKAWNTSPHYQWQGWQHIPHHISHLLSQPDGPPLKLLDIGAGSCRFVEFITQQTERKIQYHAVDFYFPPQSMSILDQYDATCYTHNIIHTSLLDVLDVHSFDVIVAFGVFHHIPSKALRKSIFDDIASLLKPYGICICTNWRFKDVKRIQKNIITDLHLFPQEIIQDLEENDHFVLGGSHKKVFRYSHYITPQEMTDISSSFLIQHSYIDDGKDHNTNHYYILSPL